MTLSSLAGKTALIVGGGRGLGRQVALSLALARCNVVIVARAKLELNAVAAEMKRKTGITPRIHPISADAKDYEQVKAAVYKTVRRFNTIDILVNCQGESLIAPIEDTSQQDWNRIIESNMTSVFNTCKVVIPIMRRQPSGHIINISSRTALSGSPNVTAYAAAKSGVIAFSKSLAAELKKDNIKVNVICPGPMDTEMRWKATPQIERKKVMNPGDVSKLIVLLASLEDSFLEEVLVPISVSF